MVRERACAYSFILLNLADVAISIRLIGLGIGDLNPVWRMSWSFSPLGCILFKFFVPPVVAYLLVSRKKMRYLMGLTILYSLVVVCGVCLVVFQG